MPLVELPVSVDLHLYLHLGIYESTAVVDLGLNAPNALQGDLKRIRPTGSALSYQHSNSNTTVLISLVTSPYELGVADVRVAWRMTLVDCVGNCSG